MPVEGLFHAIVITISANEFKHVGGKWQSTYQNGASSIARCSLICQENLWGLFYTQHAFRWNVSVFGQMLVFPTTLYNYNNGNENNFYVLYSDFENHELDSVTQRQQRIMYNSITHLCTT